MQGDSLTSIDIARDTRSHSQTSIAIAEQVWQDSIAMKTIALLGLIFLPATFVSVRQHTADQPS